MFAQTEKANIQTDANANRVGFLLMAATIKAIVLSLIKNNELQRKYGTHKNQSATKMK